MFSALRAHSNTVFASLSTSLTDYCTITAKSAVLAVSKSFHRTIVAFTAIVAVCFAVALCTVTFAERAYACTTGARFSAINADHFAISAHAAVFAPAAVLNTASAISAIFTPTDIFNGAIYAYSAPVAELRAVLTRFHTCFTHGRTIYTAFAASTDICSTLYTGSASVAEASTVACTVCTLSAGYADLFFRTVSTFSRQPSHTVAQSSHPVPQ